MTIETDASTIGWGAAHQGTRTGGPLSKQGKEDAHKLSGTASSNLGNQEFCQGQNQHSDFLESKQHNSNLVHQQIGGHSISSTEPTDQKSMALVHGQEYYTESCRQTERHCGRRVASDEGQIRLDAMPEDIQENKQGNGTTAC